MKKLVKKFITAMLAMTMVFSIVVFPAFAAQGNDGKIVITNPNVDVTYSAYKIFDMDYNDDNYAYTIDSSSAFFNAVQAYAAGEDSGLALTQIGASTTYNVNVDASKFSAAGLGAALKAVDDKGTAAATENDGTVTKDLTLGTGLAYGYYLVVGTKAGTAEALVSLDSTNTVANIVEKNDTPGWHSEDPSDPDDAKGKTIKLEENGTEKYVETSDLNIGDAVTFSIKIDAKNYAGKNLVTKYIVKDSLPDGFTFGEIKSVKVDSTVLTAESGYTAENPGASTNNILTINIPWATGSDDDGWTSTYAPSAVIAIEYTATLDSDAVIDGPGNVNKAVFAYEYGKTPENPNPENPPEIPADPSQWTDTDTAIVYTYAIALKKIDKNGTPLANATFALPSGMKVSAVNGKANTYILDPQGTITSVTTSTDDNADASFTIIGVKSGTYELEETKAPSGYNKLADKVSVEAKLVNKTASTTTTTFYLDKDGELVETKTSETVEVQYNNGDYAVTPVAVVNFTGIELPSTGGIGTTIFYVLGTICAAGAAILLITKRRMSVHR